MQFDLKSILTYLVMAILIVIIPVIAKKVVSFLQSFTKAKIEKMENENLKEIVQDVEKIICQVVMNTSQTIVDTLKKSGNFTEAEQEKAFNTTKNDVLELLSDKAEDVITNLYGNFDLWLDTKIEQTVLALKK